MANRNSYTRFRLVPKPSTLDDLERTWTAKTHFGAEKMRLLEPTAQIWIKIDPHYQRQKCRPMTLVSRTSNESGVVNDCNFCRFECMRTFAGVPLVVGLKWEWGCQRLQFLPIWVAASLETSDIRPAILYGDMLPLIANWPVTDCKMNDLEWPWTANINVKKLHASCSIFTFIFAVLLRYYRRSLHLMQYALHCGTGTCYFKDMKNDMNMTLFLFLFSARYWGSNVVYLGHGLDVSRSRDVIGHVINLSAVCGVLLTPTCYLEQFARY